MAGLLLTGFPRALTAVASVATFGAEKYDRENWLRVEDADTRYTDAMVRHLRAWSRRRIADTGVMF